MGSLRLEKSLPNKWSVRIELHYRAIGMFEDEEFVWDWIGSHAGYDRVV